MEESKSSDIEIIVVKPINKEGCNCLICPNCGAHEVENCQEKDVSKWRFQIRAFKVDDKSHCLKCDTWF